jgi:S1-C subfamily serine protease
MRYSRSLLPALTLAALAGLAAIGRADDSFAKVAEQTNRKCVKLFGSGGIRGLASYGTGFFVSNDGYILTIYSHILDTRDLRVHTYDGTRYHAEVVAVEPELDVALVRIGNGRNKKVEVEYYFDVAAAAKSRVAKPGTGILAFSNQFQIATRDEPMTVQQGVIMSYSKLYGRIGIFQATYRGDVYVVDAITNNPGAGGGVLTTRSGELLGIVGKELRNELTNTWINYAIPINATAKGKSKDGKEVTVSILDLVEKKEKYEPLQAPPKEAGGGGFHGIVLVPNVVERTPPYIDDVIPGSPAHKAKLRPDDLIVYVNGLPVGDIATFNDLISKYRPKDEIKLEIQRGEKLITVPIVLEEPKKKKVAKE